MKELEYWLNGGWDEKSLGCQLQLAKDFIHCKCTHCECDACDICDVPYAKKFQLCRKLSQREGKPFLFFWQFTRVHLEKMAYPNSHRRTKSKREDAELPQGAALLLPWV